MQFYKQSTPETNFTEVGISLSPTKLPVYHDGEIIHTHRRFGVFKFHAGEFQFGFGIDLSKSGLHCAINLGRLVFGIQLFYKDEF